jgi:hypothetical protein
MFTRTNLKGLQFMRLHLVRGMLLGVAMLSGAARAQNASVTFAPFSIYMPTNVPGIPVRATTNSYARKYNLTGWLATNADVTIASNGISPAAYAGTAPFKNLMALVQAYQRADSGAVAALYDSPSQTVIAQTLSDAAAYQNWIASVTNIQALIPLVIWQETNTINALAWASYPPEGTNAPVKTILPFLFNTNFALVAAAMESTVANDLTIYFANPNRIPGALLSPTNIAGAAPRLRSRTLKK